MTILMQAICTKGPKKNVQFNIKLSEKIKNTSDYNITYNTNSGIIRKALHFFNVRLFWFNIKFNFNDKEL